MISASAPRRKLATVLLATLAVLPASVQAQRVQLHSTVAVEAGERTPHVEPHLAVSPVHPDRLIAAAMTFPPGEDGAHIVAWYSTDGGASWRHSGLRFQGDDPWVAYAPDGSAYLSALGVVYRSDDDGRTWSGPARLPDGGGSFDYSKMVVDSDGAVHVWTHWARRDAADLPALLTSRDGGRTWEGPRPLLQSTIDSQIGALDVAPDGTLFAAFHELTHAGALLSSPRAWVVRSTDHGATWSAPSLVAESFRADSPDLVADPARDGHVLLGWMGIDADRSRWWMAVARSTDHGRTWAAPQILRDGALPEGAYPPHHPMIAVDATGLVAATWRDPAFNLGPRCFGVAFAWSGDGGTTFEAPVRIADPTCADAPGNQVPMSARAPDRTVDRRFGDGGDYHGLVALAPGVFRTVWSDTRTGVYRLWTTRITITP